ncbi:UNVERIFIED_CONTAM: hypothetical protein FKN15_005082 [Acipenser sinensis]
MTTAEDASKLQDWILDNAGLEAQSMPIATRILWLIDRERWEAYGREHTLSTWVEGVELVLSYLEAAITKTAAQVEGPPAEGKCLLSPSPTAEGECLLSLSPPAEGECLLSPCPPAEGECLLVLPPQPKWEEPEHPQPKWEEPERPQPKWEEPERPQPKREEPECPAPVWGEPERPQPKRGESVRPQPKREESVRLQPKEREVGAPTALGPKLPAEGECLLVLPPPAEGKCLLSPSPTAEGECLLVLPPQPKWEEPERPQPKREESVHPQPKREESVRLQPKEREFGASTALGPKLSAEGECLLVPPPPAEEQGLLSQCPPAEEACMLVHLLLPSRELKGEEPCCRPKSQKGRSYRLNPLNFSGGEKDRMLVSPSSLYLCC